MTNNTKILGIDLGTTNSAMAIIEGGKPKIIENAEGDRTTPSIVAMSANKERIVGQLAKRQGVTNPLNTIFSAKRLIGRKFSDAEVKKDQKTLPYEIREAKAGGVEIKMGEKWLAPAEISAMILQKLKADAEAKLGQKIDRAVITVPAYFDDSQRKATKDAGEIAGFKVERIINEPTAAALAYGFDKKKDEQIVVYDFGGGTFDVSVLEVSEDTIEVKATGGNTHLGGDDFDQEIIHFILAEFKKESGVDLSKDKMAMQRLKDAGERAKKELSSSQESQINIPFITSDASGPKHLDLKLTRAQLEKLVGEQIENSIDITKKVVKDSGLKVSDINQVILVGGQTKMPYIQKKVKELFGKDPHMGINPDEVVAAGAAVQAGVLQGDVKDVLLLDITPLTLGIETLGGVSTALISKNTTVPIKKSQIFSTAVDNQPSVEIHVLQGERQMATDNKTLGRFILSDIVPAPRGIPQIEVTFDIDANGILEVKAKDKKTGKEQSIKIEASSGLSDEEIEKMKQDAEAHADEDKKKKEFIEARNQADTLIYTSEKFIIDSKDKIKPEQKTELEEKIKTLKQDLEKDDVEIIKTKTSELSTLLSAVGQSIPQTPPEGDVKNEETKTEETKTEEIKDNK